jgi:hypothetical protein
MGNAPAIVVILSLIGHVTVCTLTMIGGSNFEEVYVGSSDAGGGASGGGSRHSAG